MWRIKDVKAGGNFAFTRNYWKSVLVAMIFVLLAGGGSFIGSNFSDVTSFNFSGDDFKDGSIVDEDDIDSAVDKIGESEELQYTVDRDEFVLDIVFVITALIIFFVVFIIVLAVQMVLYKYIYGPLDVGIKRFFLFNLMRESQVKEVMFAFDNNYKNISNIMFFKYLYTILWTLLFVIPGIIKSYEYRMIPYIVAENPTISKEDAFAISRQMMNGNKWRAFLFDLSFIGWNILSLLSFGLVGIFYVDPYKASADANLYATLKYGNVQG